MSSQMARRPPPRGQYAPKSIWHAAAGNILHYGVLVPIASPALLREHLRWSLQSWQNNRTEYAIEYRKRKAEIERKEALFRTRRNGDKPRSLPVTRPRRLTLSHDELKGKSEENHVHLTSEIGQHPAIQSQCLLLTKLPVDIRSRIWKLVVGGNVVEIFRGHGRLLHYIQDAETAEPEYGSAMPDFYPKTSKTNTLALLKTCRQIYTDAIDMLYANNTFSIWQNDTLFDLQSTVLPQRLASMKFVILHWQFRQSETFQRNAWGALEIHVDPPWDVDTWERACKILQNMPALHELLIIVRGPFLLNSDVIDMLQSLREVRVEGDFLVRVPWPKVIIRTMNDGVDRRLEDRKFPFDVFRPQDVLPDEDTGPELIGY